MKDKPLNRSARTWQKRLASFGYAVGGMRKLVQSEPHIQIHLAAASVAVLLGYGLGVSVSEWLVLLLCIGSVLCAEAFNTAIEKLCDRVTTDYDPQIGAVKDMAAAAVLIAAIASACCGGIIFLPKLWQLFFST